MRNNLSLAPSYDDCSGWALELLDIEGFGAAFIRLDCVDTVEDCTIMSINYTTWDKEKCGESKCWINSYYFLLATKSIILLIEQFQRPY